jgi:hypothetical protein
MHNYPPKALNNPSNNPSYLILLPLIYEEKETQNPLNKKLEYWSHSGCDSKIKIIMPIPDTQPNTSVTQLPWSPDKNN